MHGRQEWPATGGFASQLSQRLPSSLNESAHREGSGPPPICSFSRAEQSSSVQFSSVQYIVGGFTSIANPVGADYFYRRGGNAHMSL